MLLHIIIIIINVEISGEGENPSVPPPVLTPDVVYYIPTYLLHQIHVHIQCTVSRACMQLHKHAQLHHLFVMLVYSVYSVGHGTRLAGILATEGL